MQPKLFLNGFCLALSRILFLFLSFSSVSHPTIFLISFRLLFVLNLWNENVFFLFLILHVYWIEQWKKRKGFNFIKHAKIKFKPGGALHCHFCYNTAGEEQRRVSPRNNVNNKNGLTFFLFIRLPLVVHLLIPPSYSTPPLAIHLFGCDGDIYIYIYTVFLSFTLNSLCCVCWAI